MLKKTTRGTWDFNNLESLHSENPGSSSWVDGLSAFSRGHEIVITYEWGSFGYDQSPHKVGSIIWYDSDTDKSIFFESSDIDQDGHYEPLLDMIRMGEDFICYATVGEPEVDILKMGISGSGDPLYVRSSTTNSNHFAVITIQKYDSESVKQEIDISYDDANMDNSLSHAKYNKVIMEVNSGDQGKTVTFYYNSLDDSEGNFPDLNSSD